MPQFTILGIASAVKTLGVIEAPDAKSAAEIAWADDMINEEMYIRICHHCAREIDVGDIYKIVAEEILLMNLI